MKLILNIYDKIDKKVLEYELGYYHQDIKPILDQYPQGVRAEFTYDLMDHYVSCLIFAETNEIIADELVAKIYPENVNELKQIDVEYEKHIKKATRNRSKRFYSKTIEEILMRYNWIHDMYLCRHGNVWTLEFNYTIAVYASEENVCYPEYYHAVYTIYKDGSYKFVDKRAL